MYHNGRVKKEYHNASHWLLRRNILSAMLCLICWWAVCDTVCIGRLADHHSAVRCALKNMPMCRCANCAHCGVHFVIDRKRLHVSVCPRALVIHYTDLLTVVVRVHQLGGVRKSLVIHLPREVHHLSVCIRVYSSYILYGSFLFVNFCTCRAFIYGWCQCLCHNSL